MAKKKTKLLSEDEVLDAASKIDLEMRHLFPQGSYTMPAVLNAAIAVTRGQRVASAARARKGGDQTALMKKAEAATWHAECVAKARTLLARGKSSRELAGILAPQFNVSPRRIRDVLKKAEVK